MTIDISSCTQEGISFLGCWSEKLAYVPGYAFLMLFFLILIYRFSEEPPREQFSVSFFLSSIAAILMGVLGLISEQAINIFIVLAIASAAMLVIRN